MPAVSGTAYWASVQKPNVKFDPKWTIELILDQKEAKNMKEVMSEVTDNPKAVFQKIEKDEERGGWKVRIEQKCERIDRETKEVIKNEAPRVVDADGEPFDKNIGNGSKVKVLYRAYKSIFKGKEYVKLGLKAVKVLELVPYGDDEEEDEFFKKEGSSSNNVKDNDDQFDDDL